MLPSSLRRGAREDFDLPAPKVDDDGRASLLAIAVLEGYVCPNNGARSQPSPRNTPYHIEIHNVRSLWDGSAKMAASARIVRILSVQGVISPLIVRYLAAHGEQIMLSA
jgi:hypothetical protein